VADNPKNEYSLIFVNLLTDILNEVHEVLTSWSLVTMFSFVTNERTPTSKLAYNAIESFFANPEIYNHFKSFVISNSWNKLSIDHKLIMTKLIRNNRFPHHSRLLVNNFDLNDRQLHLETIKALRSLNDRRGNRAIMNFLDSDDLELRKEAIVTIGNTGNFFDGFNLVSHIDSDSKEIIVQAISSSRKLLGSFARKAIWNAFLNTDSKTVKTSAVRELGNIHTKQAFLNLLDAYINEGDSYIRLEIEQSLSKINYKFKDKIVLKRFATMSDDDKCKHFEVLDSFSSHLIATFLTEQIETTQDDRIIALSYSLLSAYQSDFVLNFLKVKLGDNDLYSLWAYEAILKIRFRESSTVLLEGPPGQFGLDQPHHGIYIKYVSKVAINSSEELNIAEYLTNVLRSNNKDSVYLALSCLRLAHDKNSVFVLLNEYALSPDAYFQDSVLNIVRAILYRSSPYIDSDIISHLPDEVYTELNPFLISVDLLHKFISYLTASENPFLVDFIAINKAHLRDKISTIVLAEVDDTSCYDFFRVALKIGMMLTDETEKRLRRIYFEYEFSRRDILLYFLNKKNKEDFDFITSQYSFASKFGLLPEFNKFIEATL
tara:strand:- start:1282 stop:3084 length:1803 start_codon:yes stop_codon:yes gene_type:complete